MKKFYRNSTFVAAMVASMFLLSSCEKELDDTSLTASAVSEAKEGTTTSSKTAQSVMINISAPDVIAAVDGEWVYNRKVAATFFRSSKNGDIESTISLEENKCAFFYGGSLVGKNGAEPIQTEVKAGTAWDFVPTSTETSGGREVAISFDLASQVVVDNQNQGIKYNFELLQDEISDLAVKVVNNENGEETLILLDADDYKIVLGAENPYLYGLPFYNNAGTSGKNLELLLQGMTMSEILKNNAEGFGSKDPESEAAVLQLISPLQLDLPNGTYTVTVSATYGNIQASGVSNFKVDRSFSMEGAPNCKEKEKKDTRTK